MSTLSTFHHKPLESSLKKRRQNRQFSQLHDQVSQSHIWKYLLIILIIVGIGTFLWKSPLFRVTTIKCSTQFSSSCEEAVQAELDQGKGRHILFGSWQPEIENIQRANPSYATFTLYRKFPSTIEFNITLSPPRYILSYNEQQHMVTEAGAVVHTSFSETLPIFSLGTHLAEQINEQSVIPELFHNSFLSVAVCLAQNTIEVQTIEWISASEIYLLMPKGKKALIKVEQCPDQIRQLETIWKYPFETEWTQVDLRFSKPILKE